MKRHSVIALLLLVEVVLCFGVPAYFLFWGLITLPLWIQAGAAGSEVESWTTFSILGGSVGLAGLFLVLKLLLSSDSREPPSQWLAAIVLLLFIGLAALLAFITEGFQDWRIGVNTAAILFFWAPLGCSLHLAALAIRRYRHT